MTGTMNPRDSFCSHCGHRFEVPAAPAVLGYPRTCAACKVQIWANPIPVSVALVPVIVPASAAKPARTGVLVVRRGIEPRRGKLALVGGFLEEHETWQEGAAREVREETAIAIDPASLETFWFTSTAPKPNRVLLFSVSNMPLDVGTLAPFAANTETEERGLVFGPDGLDDVFAFPLHVEAVRRFFASRTILGPHDYTQV